jgi:hypothetical protein
MVGMLAPDEPAPTLSWDRDGTLYLARALPTDVAPSIWRMSPRDGALTRHELVLGELAVEHAVQPVHLLRVARDAVRHVLRRESAEVVSLARHRPETADLPVQPLEHGVATVHVPRLRADATIIEAPSKGRVRIAVGPMKLWVETGDLFAPAPAGAQSSERKAAPSPVAAQLESRTIDNTVDVRGMRVDDAITLVESFVDRLYGADARAGYVLHGHGSGALRDAIRRHLREHVKLVAQCQAAEPDDGGDALTVFRLT